MDLQILLQCLLIIAARIGDVSLGTIRTVCIIKGRRNLAFFLGFAESLLWIVAIGTVASNLSNYFFAVSYAFGFALGNYVGMTIERRIGMGEQVVRIFTRDSEKLVTQLRVRGFKVTKFSGEGQSGTVDMLLLTLLRRKTVGCLNFVTTADPDAVFFVDDVLDSYDPTLSAGGVTKLRAWWKRK